MFVWRDGMSVCLFLVVQFRCLPARSSCFALFGVRFSLFGGPVSLFGLVWRAGLLVWRARHLDLRFVAGGTSRWAAHFRK